jgi:hypothetical protein
MIVSFIYSSWVPTAAALYFALITEEALLFMNFKLFAILKQSLTAHVTVLTGNLEGTCKDAH